MIRKQTYGLWVRLFVVDTSAKKQTNMSEEEEPKFVWSAHYDDEGQLYYYNSQTEESRWDAPEEGFVPAKDPATEDAGPQWVAYKDEKGEEYYYNSVTGQTQWDRPEGEIAGAPPAEEEIGKEEALVENPETEPMVVEDSAELDQTDDVAEAADAESGPISMEEEKEEEEPEPEIDPAALRLQNAREALEQPDSILESNCIANVIEVVNADKGNPQKAIDALAKNYHAQTTKFGLLCQWLTSLKNSNRESKQKENSEEIRDKVSTVLNKIVKENFSKERGDGILELSKAEAAFLESMMDSARWRQLLIDLSARHEESSVLTYCLKSISRRGYHREIFSRITPSKHFVIFNAMLRFELSVMGKTAAGAVQEGDVVLPRILNELVRNCTLTSFTYFYSRELLQHLIDKTKEQCDSSPRLQQAVQKWEALAEAMEIEMMDPAKSQALSVIFRKRRLDFALNVSSLSQGRRKRRRDENADSNQRLETALINFITRYSKKISMDDKVLNSLLPSGLDLEGTGKIGKLLIRFPLAIQALLIYLFKPGPMRVTDIVMKNKCAKLLALATIEAEKIAMREEGSRFPNTQKDELSLSRMIVEGSQLCELLENKVAFLVASAKTGTEPSFGQKLCSLALGCAPVAQGVVLWAKHLTEGPEFATSASFSTLSVSVLSLVRVVSTKHPFTAPDALQVALAFLKHSNPDTSHKTITSIREQTVRLLITLVVSGHFVSTLETIANGLEKNEVEIDNSLLRYLVAGLLEVVRPPISMVFVRSFGKLLLMPKCIEAVRSNHFKDGNENQVRLAVMLKEMKKLDSESPENGVSLVRSLLETYEAGN